MTLSLRGVPGTTTATLSDTTLQGLDSVSTLTVAVSQSSPAGTFAIAVHAEAAGTPTRVDTLAFAIAQRTAALRLRRVDTLSDIVIRPGGPPMTLRYVVDRDGLTGPLAFAQLETLPAGLHATFAPDTTDGNETTLTVRADSSVALRSYTLRLRATLEGLPSAFLRQSVRVTDDNALTVSLSPSTVSMQQNGSNEVRATVRSTAIIFSNALRAEPLPPGTTVRFEQSGSSASSWSFRARFTTSASTPVGTYPITIRASRSGFRDGEAELMLTVTPAAAGGAITFGFCGPPSAQPLWFGVRGIAGNDWVRREPDASGRFAFDVGSQAKATVAWVTASGADDFHLSLVQALGSELAAYAATRCDPTTARDGTGTVAGIAPGTHGDVAVGPRRLRVSGDGPFTLANVWGSAFDLLAARYAPGDTSRERIADRFVRVPTRTTPAFGTVDLTAGTTLLSHVVRVSGAAPSDSITFERLLATALGTELTLGWRRAPGDSSTLPFVPAAQLAAGDLHGSAAEAAAWDGPDRIARRVELWRAEPESTPLVLGEPVLAFAVDIFASDGNFARYSVRVPRLAQYQRLFLGEFRQALGATRRTLTFLSTEAGNTLPNFMHDLSGPDFAGAPGFDLAWQPRVALPVDWTITAWGWTGAGGLATPRAEGLVVRGFSRSGRFVVP